MSSEINAPADALSLIRTMQAANAALDAAAEALRKSTGLSAWRVDDHGDLVWGLDGHDDASRGVLYAQVRAGEELLFETSVESFQEIDDTHAVVIEWDPECGNALHLLRRDKRDDAAAAKRAADAWKAEEDRMMRDSMMGREGTVTP